MSHEIFTSIRKRYKWKHSSNPVASYGVGNVINKLKKYEQALKLRSDLKEAFDQVDLLKKQEGRKDTLNEFLNEL